MKQIKLRKLLPHLTLRVKRPEIPTLRTFPDEMKYLHDRLKGDLIPLHLEERLKEWKYWAIIENKYPYSAIVKTHHLLLPKRAISEGQLSDAERKELQQILRELDISGAYDCYLSNFRKKQSITDHYHIHLLVFRTDEFNFKK